MKVHCEQLDEILERQEPAELAALETHALDCAACAVQVQLEREISSAAPGLRKDWPSPSLWPRIARALDEQSRRGNVLAFPRTMVAHWRLAAAAAVLMIVTVSATWFALQQNDPGTAEIRTPAPAPAIDDSRRLLTEQALREVEKTEAAYMQSIDRLAALAAPILKQTDSALITNYREKLLVLDSAIAEIRAQADRNQFNTHLRKELLAVYQAKQQTLQQLIREEAR